MGITKNTRHLLEDDHPELLTCMRTGKPSEVYWVGPNIALTADEALAILPRLVADAVAMKMGRPDNAAVEAQLITDILSQVSSSLHSGPRQWGNVSDLVLDTPGGRVDVLALSHEAPLNESAYVTAAHVATNLASVQADYERQVTYNVPLRYWPRPFEQSARHLMGLLRRANILDEAFEAVRGEPWPEPLELATLPATISRVNQLVEPFVADLHTVTPEQRQNAPELLRLALRLLSRAQEAAVLQEQRRMHGIQNQDSQN